MLWDAISVNVLYECHQFSLKGLVSKFSSAISMESEGQVSSRSEGQVLSLESRVSARNSPITFLWAGAEDLGLS